jgi:hypothetical protein
MSEPRNSFCDRGARDKNNQKLLSNKAKQLAFDTEVITPLPTTMPRHQKISIFYSISKTC